MQIKCEKSANFFKFVPLCDAFIGFVTSGHEEEKSKKTIKNRFYCTKNHFYPQTSYFCHQKIIFFALSLAYIKKKQ